MFALSQGRGSRSTSPEESITRAESAIHRANQALAQGDAVEKKKSDTAEPADSDQKLRRNFGKGAPATIAEMPDGELKTKLLSLSPERREFALEWLQFFSFSGLDAANSLNTDEGGGIYYVCAAKSEDSAGSYHEGCSQPGKHADHTTFNETEQSDIKDIWKRVAEDFAPFDVNVTTLRPADGGDE